MRPAEPVRWIQHPRFQFRVQVAVATPKSHPPDLVVRIQDHPHLLGRPDWNRAPVGLAVSYRKYNR